MGLLDLFKSRENKRISEFATRLDEIESQIRLLRMEWNESYDKIHHALDRVSKRWTRIHSTAQEDNGGDQKPANQTVEDLWKLARSRGMVR